MMNREKGFTLVELLIATAITGLMVSALGTAVFQITRAAEYGNAKLTAVHEIQNVARWFNLDGQRAVAANVNNGLLLTVSDNSLITYAVNGTELRRTASGLPMTLARNITSANFSVENRTIIMTITSSPAGRPNVSEPGTYQVTLRPGEE